MPTRHSENNSQDTEALRDSDSKIGLRGRRSKQIFVQRLESTTRLVGYTIDDEDRVWATRDVLLPRADAIAGAVYDHLLAHPETAVHFTQADGRPDRAHLAARADSLKGWLRMAIESPLNEALAAYLAGIGHAHTRRGGSPGARILGRYMLVTMSFVQTALIGLLDPAIPDRAELLLTIAAWNKLLMIHLDLFLAVYGSAEATPHWY
jgi:Protoglobin